jgi:acyl-CoA reductase-like NAD-dependent aldehyde dehydrogenase
MSVRISNDVLQVFNPVNQEELSTLPITSLQELNEKLHIAKTAAENYNFSSFFRRQKLLSQFRREIVKNMDAFVETICKETGKKEAEGLMEVFISLEHLRYAVKNLYEALGPQKRRSGLLLTKKAWVEYEAMGVAGIISPWNYPLILTVSPLAEALLAGNTVVLKPSEQTPLTTELLKKVWDKATGMGDLFQVVYGAGEVGSALVSSSLTDVICFTGSTAVGRKIAEVCAPMFKPVILELGGKDPMIVLEDASLKRTVQAAIWGGMSNAGQTCISVERIYAHENIYSQLVENMSASLKKVKCGVEDSEVGSISVEVSLEKIKNQIKDAESKGEVIQNGAITEGWFIPPTLVINPSPDSKIMQEETFGPVITIHPFKTDEEAVKLANGTGYGLSASIFGKNRKRIRKLSRRIQAGAVSVNDVLTHYGIADLPFGGYGLSGIGKVHGKEGLRAFSRQKAYMQNRIQFGSEIWWYGQGDFFRGALRKFIKIFYA